MKHIKLFILLLISNIAFTQTSWIPDSIPSFENAIAYKFSQHESDSSIIKQCDNLFFHTPHSFDFFEDYAEVKVYYRQSKRHPMILVFDEEIKKENWKLPVSWSGHFWLDISIEGCRYIEFLQVEKISTRSTIMLKNCAI